MTVKKNGNTLRIERTRLKILDAAKKIFLEKGYKDTTVTLMAERASVGYGTVYAHFSNGKDEVLLNIMESIMSDFYQIAQTAYTPNNAEEAYVFTLKNTNDFLEMASIHQKWLALFHEAIGQSSLMREAWDEITQKFIERISKNVDTVKQKGLIRNPEYDSQVVAGILFYPGEKYLWKIALGKTEKDYREIAQDIAKMYTHGLFK